MIEDSNAKVDDVVGGWKHRRTDAGASLGDLMSKSHRSIPKALTGCQTVTLDSIGWLLLIQRVYRNEINMEMRPSMSAPFPDVFKSNDERTQEQDRQP